MTTAYDLGPDFTGGPQGTDRSLLAHVLSLQPKGWAVEFGVGSGGTLAMIAAVMPVVGFDSFDGLPEHWRPGYPRGKFATRPVLDMPGTSVVRGLFEDTLPDYDWPDELGLVHLDADLYSSTKTALSHVGPHIRSGCFVVLDEFYGYDGCEDHEQRAWAEFVERSGVEYDVIGHGREQWAVQIR
jgi:hypothetical protein